MYADKLKNLSAAKEKITKKLYSCSSNDDLARFFIYLEDEFNIQNLNLLNSVILKYIILAIILLIAILGLFFRFYTNPDSQSIVFVIDFNPSTASIIFFLVGISLGVVFYIFLIKPGNDLINDISWQIFHVKLYLLYSTFNSDNLKYKKLREKYSEFNRGDEQQEIIFQRSGVFKDINFDVYTFRFVNVYYVQVEKTDEKGNKKTVTERREEICYRYGLICQSGLINNVAIERTEILNLKSQIWHPTAPEFTKNWKIYRGDDMNLARFLTPSKVLEFIKFRNYSPSAINLEVVNSVLCLAYSVSAP